MRTQHLRQWMASMICIMLAFSFVQCQRQDRDSLIVVPDLRGKPLVEAKEDLEKLSLKADPFEGGFYASIPQDYVVTQVPYPLTRVKPGRVVRLEISRGISSIQMPLLEGMKFGDVYEFIKSLGLSVESINEVSEAAPPGTILEQYPTAGEMVELGSGVQLTIALPEIPLTPDWIGQHFEDVKYSIIEKGYILGSVIFEPSSFHPRGVVYVQEPVPYSPAEHGSPINIVVNEAP